MPGQGNTKSNREAGEKYLSRRNDGAAQARREAAQRKKEQKKAEREAKRTNKRSGW